MGFAILISIDRQPFSVGGSVDLVPFDSIGGAWVAQTMGNVLVFATLGALLGSVWLSSMRVIVTGALFVLSLELAQYVFPLGRVPATEDLIVGIGALAGGLAFRRQFQRRTAGRTQPASAGSPVVRRIPASPGAEEE